MKVALLGSMPKGDSVRDGWADWKLDYSEKFQEIIPGIEIIHGDSISDNAGATLVVGHDLAQVKNADICVVDARSKVGAGTAQEMVIAKYFKKPVVAVIPKDSHHRKSNVSFHGVTMVEWIHPFLKVTSDFIADSIEDAAHWIKSYAEAPEKFKIKDITVFDGAIYEFESSELQK